jgi:hypothetical protein
MNELYDAAMALRFSYVLYKRYLIPFRIKYLPLSCRDAKQVFSYREILWQRSMRLFRIAKQERRNMKKRPRGVLRGDASASAACTTEPEAVRSCMMRVSNPQPS